MLFYFGNIFLTRQEEPLLFSVVSSTPYPTENVSIWETDQFCVYGCFGPLPDSPKVHFHASLLLKDILSKSLRSSLIMVNYIGMWVYMTWSEKFSLSCITWEKLKARGLKRMVGCVVRAGDYFAHLYLCRSVLFSSFSQFFWMSSCIPSWWVQHWAWPELLCRVTVGHTAGLCDIFFPVSYFVHFCLCLSFFFFSLLSC